MQYRSLGRTGVKVSTVCLGTMNFGGRTDEAEAAAVLLQALDAGINFIDTANVYGHDPANFKVGRGRSEQILGRTIGKSSVRDKIVLATKAHFPVSDDPNDQGNSRRHLTAQVQASLQR